MKTNKFSTTTVWSQPTQTNSRELILANTKLCLNSVQSQLTNTIQTSFEQVDIENDDPLLQGYIYKIERNGTVNKTKFGIMKDVFNNCYILTSVSHNVIQSIIRKLPKSLTNM